MKFSVWFKLWINTFYKLLFRGGKHKSEWQRKRERERRLKAKRSSKSKYRLEKKRIGKRRRRGAAGSDEFAAMVGLVAVTFLGLILLPIGLLDFGVKNIKTAKANKKRGTGARKTQKSEINSKSAGKYLDANRVKSSAIDISAPNAAPKHAEETEFTPDAPDEILEKTERASCEITEDAPDEILEKTERAGSKISADDYPKPAENFVSVEAANDEISAEVRIRDEKIPKSTPMNEGDKYIRRRMLIRGYEYCNTDAAKSLKVGACLEALPEPNNPYDKYAVKLTFRGEKVGYLPRGETLALIACFDLGYEVYAIITDAFSEGDRIEYEIELWIAN